jgi:hypothetical protein
MMLERVQVADDVDQRFVGVDLPGTGRGMEDGRQGVEVALPGGARHQRRVHVVAVAFDTVMPVGNELEIAEALEDLDHLHPDTQPAMSADVDL